MTGDLALPGSPMRVRLAWIETDAMNLRERAVPGYAVDLGGRELLRPSRLGLVLVGAPPLTGPFELVGEERAGGDSTRPTPLGEHAASRDRFAQVTLRLRETVAPRRSLAVALRVFDDGRGRAGVAVRYELPPELRGAVIEHEATEFGLPAEATTYAGTWWEDEYGRRPADEIPSGAWFPVTAELPGGGVACLAEADVRDFSTGRLRWGFNPRLPDSGRLRVELAAPCPPRADGTTPWRVILLAGDPAGLIGRADQIENLCPPSRLHDEAGPLPAWVRPGKIVREMTLSTPGAAACLDFAAERNLSYLLFDAGWYGHEYDEAPEATRVDVDPRRVRDGFGDGPFPGLDLPGVVAAARRRGVGVFCYVNRRQLERNLEPTLDYLAGIGVAGVKFGFVNVGPAGWTRWLFDAVAACADRRLLVNVHDAHRPTGLSRTWPNLLTCEGVRGNEHHPGAAHNLTLPFTRAATGAADYTVCFRHPKGATTDAHQMAMALLVPTPLLTLYWYGRPAEFAGAGDALRWFDALPTTWDETRGLGGEVGRWAAVARRSGRRWFVAQAGAGAADRPLPADLASLPAEFDFRDAGGRVRVLDAGRRGTVPA